MKTIELMKKCLSSFFEAHAPEQIPALLAESFCACGLGSGGNIVNAAQAQQLLSNPEYRIFMDYEYRVLSETEVSPESAVLGFTLTKMDVTLEYRVSGVSCDTESGRRLQMLHFSLCDSRQTLTLFQDLASARRVETGHELLDQTMPGGLIGAYQAEGLPLYQINARMLKTLGYRDEAEYRSATGGSVELSLHPEDRPRILAGLAQLKRSADMESQNDFRMLRRDGSVVWIHAAARGFTAEDGRPAALAACYDVTRDREHSLLLDNLMRSIDGDVCIFKVDEVNRRTIPVHLSDHMGERQGLSHDEYLSRFGSNGMDSIYPDDRAQVWASMLETVRSGRAATVTFRVRTQGGKAVWMNGSYACYGEQDGLPLIRVLFTPASVQYDMQRQALSQESTGVCMIDAETDELYYANDAAFLLHGVTPRDYTGMNCFEAFYGETAACESCGRRKFLRGEAPDDTVFALRGRQLSAHVSVQSWNGRRVAVTYLQDVTERVRLQQQVLDGKQELERLLHNLACGVSVLRFAPGKAPAVRYVSDGLCRIFEGERDALIAKLSADPYYCAEPEEVPAMREFLAACQSGPGEQELTYRVISCRGNRRALMLRVIVVADGEDGLTGYASYFDVTARVRAQKQLTDLVQNVPGGICMFRWNGEHATPVVLSDQAVRLFGMEGRSSLERLHDGLVHPDDLPAMIAAMHAQLKNPGGEYTLTYRVWNAARQVYRWVAAANVHIPQEDGTQLIYTNYTDVNELKALEQSVRQGSEVLLRACDFAGLWVWVYHISENRLECSKKLQRDFGMPEFMDNYPECWLSMGFIQPESIEEHRLRVAEIKNGAESVEFVCRIRHADESLHWTRIRINRLAENPDLAVGTAVLIDNEKYLEARIELEERQQSEGGANLLAHFLTNLTENRVLEHRYKFDESAELLEWNSLEDQLARTLPRIVSPEKRVAFQRLHDRQRLLEMYAGGKTEDVLDYRRLLPDGRIIWVRSVIHLVREPRSGNILNYESVYDVHQQKIYEELMTAVVEFGFELCASLMLDSNQVTVLYARRQNHAERLVVGSYSEINGAYAETICEEDREKYLAASSPENIIRRLKTDSYFEIMHRTLENGEIRYKKDQCYSYSPDSNTCLLVRSDVTDVVLREREKQQELQAALEQARSALAAREEISQDRRRIYAALFSIVPMVISANLTKNRYSMLNYEHYTTKVAPESGSYDELIRAGLSTVPKEQRAAFAETFGRENLIAAYESGRASVLLEHQQRGDDGVVRWIEMQCVFVRGGAEEDLYAITLARDVSGRKQRQLELRQALDTAEAATLAKSEFLSRMSHEIRTPMNAIMGMTNIAQENVSDRLQVEDCLNKIDMSSHYLLALINDILEMSRIESGRTEIRRSEFSFEMLVESIRTVVEPLALKSELRYEFINRAQTDAYYRGDAIRIQQVLVNLLGNAVKFTQKGGRVRFSVSIESQTESRTQFCFVVSDTGIGMSEAFMEKMFMPFTQEDGGNTSRYGGSGLGLAIAKSLVEAMNGSITADSMPGVGSTFTVLLPLERLNTAQPAEAAGPETQKSDPALLSGCRVLMAEDHPLNVMVARKLLERRGVSVTVAENGQLAVEKFAASKPDEFDAILMDIRMPVMDGLDATRAIRALDRPDAARIPIIAMTANALEEDRQRSRDAGMNEHLAKPFEPDRLYSTLAEQIERTKKR